MMLGGEDPETIRTAHEMTEKANTLEALPAEMRGSILSAIVRTDNGTELAEKLLGRYPETDPEMQLDISVALAATRNVEFAQETIHSALGKDGFVRPQDFMRWIAYFLRNYRTRAVMWDFLEEDWQRLEKIFENSKSFDFLPVYASQVVTSAKWADRYRSFFEPLKENPYLTRNIQIGEADITARVAWREREESNINEWLSQNFSNSK